MKAPGSSAIESYLPSTLLASVAGAPGVQAQLAAVLSIDIAGFTHISDVLLREHAVGVDQLSRVLNEFFSELISEVEQHGGELISIQGDGTLAAWLAPAGQLEQAVEHAARCGLALSRSLDGHRGVAGSPLRVRVGLGCGPLLLARLGDETRWTLSVAGQAAVDAVLAERQADLGTLTISAAAWACLPAKRRGRTLRTGSVELLALPPGNTRQRPPSVLGLDDQELLRYLPAPVRARVTSDVPLWQAEVRYVTAAFLHLQNPDGSDLTPQQAQDPIRILQEELARCGGGIDEISFHDKGCVATAVFGLPPESYEDDARRALTSALAIRARAGAVGVDVSVGIASGLAFWGPIGRESRRRFTLLGSAMNLACRLMQHARAEVLCCPSTMEALAGRVSGEHAGAQLLKGFDLPVPVFRAHAIGAPRSNKGQLLGRSVETGLLAARLEQARAGQGSVLWIEAGPGLGKSALVGELEARGRAADLPVLIAHGDAVEHTTPYHAWEGPITQLLGLDASAPLAERTETVIARIDAIPEAAGLAPLLAPILRLPLIDSDKTRLLEGLARADRTADLFILLTQTLRGSYWF
jgi:class 3 adenylate cyclase